MHGQSESCEKENAERGIILDRSVFQLSLQRGRARRSEESKTNMRSQQKNPAAVALGRLGGKIGGRATGKAKARSSAQARAAVNARWEKYRQRLRDG